MPQKCACRHTIVIVLEGEAEITTKIVRERTTICTGGTYHTNRANKEANLMSSTRIAISVQSNFPSSFPQKSGVKHASIRHEQGI